MAVTIKDVAARAGVSTSTVSRVCNGTATTARETRERVLKAIEELGYEVGGSAESNQTPAAISVAVVMPPASGEDYENAFYMKALMGIGEVCNQRHASTTLVTGKDLQELLTVVQGLHRSGRADGFILLYSRKDDPVARYLMEQGLLFVVVGKVQDAAAQCICVDNDNLLAARDATDYLYNLGHRRIACITEKQEYGYSFDRRSGYQLSMLQHGLPLEPEHCLELESVRREDLEALRSLLSREDRPTAFVVCDDILAIALERICKDLGIAVPEDISMITFNDSLYVQLAIPQLTAVDINPGCLGNEAAVQILNRVENPGMAATRTVIPHRIVERSSCRAV